MKKLVSIMIIVLAAALVFAACTPKTPVGPEAHASPYPAEPTAEAVTEAPTAAPTEIPTEAPTPEPTAEPTPIPTEVPVELSPHPEGDYFAPVRNDLPFIVDIDGDGENDIGLIAELPEDDDFRYYVVSITRACDPDNTFTFTTSYGFGGAVGAIFDLDPSDPQKELVFAIEDEGGMVTYAARMKDDGSGLEYFEERMQFYNAHYYYDGFPDDLVFTASEGIPCAKRTDILGTYFVENRFTVTSEGFKMLSDEFIYDKPFELTLKRDMELKANDGSTVVAKAGEKIVPTATDMVSYVKVKLENGTICRAEVTIDDYMPWINGIDQNEYAEIPYAG